MKLGTYIKTLRQAQDLSQFELSMLLGHRDQTLLSRIEANKTYLPLGAYKTLIKALKADKDLMLEYYLERYVNEFNRSLKNEK